MQNNEKKVGIIGAMDIEVKKLKSQMLPLNGESSVKETKLNNLVFVEGILNNTQVVVVQSGVGKVNAALCAQRLILQFGVTHVINTGIAGAMALGLTVLDFVVSKDALYHDFDVTGFGYKPTVIPAMEQSNFLANENMINATQKAFAMLEQSKGHKLIVGRIASGDQFIASSDVKKHIKEICKPSCVEMEGAAIAHACYFLQVPFVIIRCMSDMAEDSGESVYTFNEQEAAELSASLVFSMLNLF